ncbi:MULTISPECIES: cytochrome c550 [unclassified Planococcus (in: firmicutes)]|uniref:cytochrome c550 n=1 Tax=unclassified Planococcus (in: firmicutes) TaxID=2662419 RepID=UPI000C33D8EE|nr:MULTISPECIES: cytochrome c [unclassified Planococcus (in: firmicutes)]AUD13754.1 cytochrome C [Planococcus sp. MB-3u-03]PKG45768.1 cytochrome C [Planococcus sp. Urea-trap-24]PKG88523.1 cytochrome C [Planococcus sp. Urea-3u-39]PKH38759.1 cytochrome C [Planococcus sp. MB-3u-09]
MQKNAIVPYILIMAFGIGLIFFLSLEGVGNEAEIAEEQAAEEGGGEEAAEGEGGEEAASGDFDPEATAQASCVSCHGSSYEGGVGPSLVGTALSQEEIEEILINGKGTMPAGLVPEENVPAMAEWVLSLE